MKLKIIINCLLIMFYLVVNSQELVNKTDVMTLSLNKRVFIQENIVDNDTINRKGFLIELFDKTHNESGRLMFNTFLEYNHGIEYKMKFDIIADLVYEKKLKKVFFVMAQKANKYFTVYSVDYSFVPKPIPNVRKYSLLGSFNPTEEEKQRIDEEIYIENGRPISVFHTSISPFIKHIDEIKISIIEEDIHILINESTDKQKLVYNESEGWRLLE